MKYTSENMNYIFNVSYFDDIDWAAFGSSKEENDSILKQHNDAIRDFSFINLSRAFCPISGRFLQELCPKCCARRN